MALRIDLNGVVDHVVVSSLARSFVNRVYKHCRGKNNTPYFANNCFKGILYFDSELARKYAQQTGYDWTHWNQECRFFSKKRHCLENNLEISVFQGGTKIMDLSPVGAEVEVVDHSPSDFLAELAEEEVMVIMGAVDKGDASYHLDDFQGEFDPMKLSFRVDAFEEFLLKDRIIDALLYDGREMRFAEGRSRGKNMITPTLFSRQGEELDINDFVE